MAELDPKRLEELEAEERARLEIRKKLEASSGTKKNQTKVVVQHNPYKGMGCGFIMWGLVLTTLFGVVGIFIPPLLIVAVITALLMLVGFIMWIIWG
ncbi:hypothetical protein [Meiothermus ruber]|uniref:hypothetical protein n=1 Tax=Meiothermus ruber TaxID=277 RepID=UPI000566C242|nr:hypothetical protein [Meiothermus ruber]